MFLKDLFNKTLLFCRKNSVVIIVISAIIVGATVLFYSTDFSRIIRKKWKSVFGSSQKIPALTLTTDPIEKHRTEAKRHGISFLHDADDIENYLTNRRLVRIKNKTGYKIEKLNFSHPVLTPGAYKALREIGRRFDDITNGDFFVVTSITRTEADQRRLRKNNINATPNESTHSYGCSFDISYTRFNGERGYNPLLQKALESVLEQMRREGKILVIKEKRLACYHVTAVKQR